MEVKKVVELDRNEAGIIDALYDRIASVKEAIDHHRVINDIQVDTPVAVDDTWPYEQFRAMLEDLSCIHGLLLDLSPSVKPQLGKNARF